MAALTLNTWHFITLAAVANPPYVPPNSALDGLVLDYILGVTSFPVFCTAVGGATSTFVYVDGGSVPVTVPNNAITIDSTPLMDTSVLATGETWYSVRDTGISWSWYSSVAGVISRMPTSNALGLFIT